MTTTIGNLTQRAEFAKKYIKDMLKETGLCIYGADKENLYLADRQEVANGTAQLAVCINMESINNLSR